MGQELLGGLEARVEGAWRRGIPSGDTSVPSCLKHQFLGDFPGEPLSPEVAVARRLLVDGLPQVQFSAQTSGRGQFLARAAPSPSPSPRGHTQISLPTICRQCHPGTSLPHKCPLWTTAQETVVAEHGTPARGHPESPPHRFPPDFTQRSAPSQHAIAQPGAGMLAELRLGSSTCSTTLLVLKSPRPYSGIWKLSPILGSETLFVSGTGSGVLRDTLSLDNDARPEVKVPVHHF